MGPEEALVSPSESALQAAPLCHRHCQSKSRGLRYLWIPTDFFKNSCKTKLFFSTPGSWQLYLPNCAKCHTALSSWWQSDLGQISVSNCKMGLHFTVSLAGPQPRVIKVMCVRHLMQGLAYVRACSIYSFMYLFSCRREAMCCMRYVELIKHFILYSEREFLK